MARALEDRLGRRLGPESLFYDDWISMDHRLEWTGQQNSMSTGFRWRMDLATDSDPNSMTFRLGWMIDWAADSPDPTTVFGWIMDSGWAGKPNSMTTGFRVG